MTKDEVIARVRTILDYNQTSSELDGLDVMGGLDLDTIIDDSIPGALQQLVMVAPIEMLGIMTESAEVKRVEGQPTTLFQMPYTMELPSDYLRFVSCQAEEWDYPVTVLTEAGSKEHQKQYSEFGGLKATAHNPIAVMQMKDDAMSIVLFGGKETRKVSLHYISTPSVETLDARLQEPLCYIVASLVCEVLKDTNKSQMLMQTAQSLMVTAEAIGQNINNTNTEE